MTTQPNEKPIRLWVEAQQAIEVYVADCESWATGYTLIGYLFLGAAGLAGITVFEDGGWELALYVAIPFLAWAAMFLHHGHQWHRMRIEGQAKADESPSAARIRAEWPGIFEPEVRG